MARGHKLSPESMAVNTVFIARKIYSDVSTTRAHKSVANGPCDAKVDANLTLGPRASATLNDMRAGEGSMTGGPTAASARGRSLG
jgi:hypothetical protein